MQKKTTEMNHEQLLAQVIQHYDLKPTLVSHLGTVWNTTYRITTGNGSNYNLRLCNTRFQDRASLQAELDFLDFVAKRQQVRVPQPIVNCDNEFVTVVSTSNGDQLCCLFAWIEGEEARTRLSLPVIRQIGRNMAFLHEAARAYSFPTTGNGLREGYCYDDGLIRSHREWIAQRANEIDPANIDLLHEAIEYVLEAFTALDKSRDIYGFIHADLHLGNFIVHDHGVAVIDFDQLGRGHFCYDIALLMVELMVEPHLFTQRWQHFKAGYQEVAALPFVHEQMLEPFVVAIHLTFLDAYYNSWTVEGKARFQNQLSNTYDAIRNRLRRI